MDNINTKKTYPSTSQKQKLLNLIEADEELRQRKFSSTFTKKIAEARWGEIAEEINSIPGTQKDWKGWRKVSAPLYIAIYNDILYSFFS